MKALKTLLATFLILIIVGGLGYIAWSFLLMPGMNHSGMNTPPSPTTESNQNQQSGTTNNAAPTNTVAVQNRDRLNQAISLINQAMDLITIDPYSKATASSSIPGTTNQAQPSQGNGTINIYPSGSGSVNINPPGNTSPNNTASSTNTNQGATTAPPNNNIVYDQTKLQQLHNGIFTLAQGVMTINSLSDDLLVQASAGEVNPPNYQTYVIRYNTALQNKTRLNNAMSMLTQASTLVNVNPYASPNGYQYNNDAMQQLHQGVYKLAQGMALLTRLNEDFTKQMAEASVQAQNLANTAYQMPDMTSHSTGMFGAINTTTIFNIILIVMVIGLIAGVLGAIFNMFNAKRRNNGNGNGDNPGSEPNVL